MTYKAIVQNGMIVLPPDAEIADGTSVDITIHPSPSRLGELLKHAGTWHGDDAEEIVDLIYKSRWKPSSRRSTTATVIRR
jgi:hypothetical protein